MVGNVFPKKSHQKCGGETTPRPFFKIKIEHISEQQSEVLYSLFLLYLQV